MNYDDFFEPLANTKPYLKVALEGFAGTGKTLTATHLAIGLRARIRSTKPILLFDTEESMSRIKGVFVEAGLDPAKDVRVRRSRSMADLAKAMDACDEGYADILLIDSITHIWEDFQEAHKRNVRRVGNLQMDDWGVIKPAWKREFSERYVRGHYHAIFTGRAGFEYDTEINEKGKREFFKAGVKMKVEGETAYEPDILVLMSRFEEGTLDGAGALKVWREAKIIKDRSRKIDGQTFENPTYESFAPAVEELLSNPSAIERAREGDASELIEVEENRREWLRSRDGLLEEIEAELVKAHPGQSGADKKAKIVALEAAFGTASWTNVSKKKTLDELRAGLQKIRAHLTSTAACEVCGGVGGKHETSDCPAGPTPAVPAPVIILPADTTAPPASIPPDATANVEPLPGATADQGGAVVSKEHQTGNDVDAAIAHIDMTAAAFVLCLSVSDRTKGTFCVLPKNHAESCLPGTEADVGAALDALDRLNKSPGGPSPSPSAASRPDGSSSSTSAAWGRKPLYKRRKKLPPITPPADPEVAQ